VNLLFALSPEPGHRLTLTVEVGLHLGKPGRKGRRLSAA
jgi:hypothetical protein